MIYRDHDELGLKCTDTRGYVSRVLCLVLFLGIVLSMASCNLLGNDDDDTDRDGWKKISMPQKLRGEWFANEYYENYYIKISSNQIFINNRTWSVQAVEKKNSEYRLLAKSTNQYRAYFFRDLSETGVDIALGYLAFTTYDAKVSGTGSWQHLTRMETE